MHLYICIYTYMIGAHWNSELVSDFCLRYTFVMQMILRTCAEAFNRTYHVLHGGKFITSKDSFC